MNKQFIQYISLGIGLIENVQEVSNRIIEENVEKALKLEEDSKDIKIIGFRFFDRAKDNSICNISGVFYLNGEVYTYPKISTELLQFIHNIGVDYKKGQQLIVTGSYTPMIYEFTKDDKILDIEDIKKRLERKRQKEREVNLTLEITKYKEKLCLCLEKIAGSIRANEYKYIPLKGLEIEAQENPKYKEVFVLDILNDGGDFKVHIDQLKYMYKELHSLEESLSGINSIVPLEEK